MPRSANVLSVCRNGGPFLTRNAVLKRAGYRVVAATGLDEALDAAYSGAFDLVIVGHLFNEAEKNMIATAARRAGAKVLCMYSEAQPPKVQAANVFIHSFDGPERLVSGVAELLHKAASA
jgi:hypothetical protein